MPTAQEFVKRAMQNGYSVDEITQFLSSTEKQSPKQKEAIRLVETSTEKMNREEGESTTGDILSKVGKTALNVGVPAALAYSGGAPIAAAIEGLGSRAGLGALGAEAMGAMESGGISEALKGMNPNDLLNLVNTYRNQGAGATLTEIARQFMSGQPGETMATQAQAIEIPPEIQQEALNDFQTQQDPLTASTLTNFRIMESKSHPLKNLAKTLEKKSGQPFQQLVFEFLSSQVQGQDVDMGMEEMQAPTMQQSQVDLTSMSDQDLMSLMQQRGLL